MQSKFFEFAREFSRYTESSPESELATSNIIPQFVFVGDQSSGKTTNLCRLACLPLGFTANSTGTRRPFEYTFIHDDSCVEPRVTVDSKLVEPGELLRVMRMKNGTTGFKSDAVSVKIESKNIAMDMIVVDMPGMKDGEDGPEKMVLERLAKYPDATPVVVLEPRDLGSAHYVLKVLQRARPARSLDKVIALVNKCDLQMSGNGEWLSPSSWEEWWRGAQSKGFKHLFCVGWPGCTERSSSDPQLQMENLTRSSENEDALIKEFVAIVGKDAEDVMGLRRFQSYLHRDQASKMQEFAQTSGPRIDVELQRLDQQLSTMDHDAKKTLENEKYQLIDHWCKEGSQMLQGQFDPHFQEGKTNLKDDLESLSQDIHRLSQLPSAHKYGKVAEELAQDQLIAQFLPFLPDCSLPFIGKAALERTVQLIYSWAFLGMTRQKVMEFTETFILNIHSRAQEDTGNMVVKEFCARVMAQTFHPLVDVLCLLVWRHLETALLANLKSQDGKDWLRIFKTFENTTLLGEFEHAVKTFVKELVADLSKDLHERLNDQAGSLQGGYHSSARGRTLASNTAGIQGLDSHEQVHDQPLQPPRPRTTGDAPSCWACIGSMCGPTERKPCSMEETAVQPSMTAKTTVPDEKEEFNAHVRRFLNLASQELAQAGQEGEQVGRLADKMQVCLGLMHGRFQGKQALQDVFTRVRGSVSWRDHGAPIVLCPDGDTAVLMRSIPFMVKNGTCVKVIVNAAVVGCPKSFDLAGRHADVAHLPKSFAGVAIRGMDTDTWLASACVSAVGESELILNGRLMQLVDKIVHLELIATSGMRLSVNSVELRDSAKEVPEMPTPSRATPAASQSARAAAKADAGALALVSQHVHAMKPYFETMRKSYKAPREKQARGMDLQKLHNDTSYELIWQLDAFRKHIDQRVSCMRKKATDDLMLRILRSIGNGCLQMPVKLQRKELKDLRRRRDILLRASALRQDLIGDSSSDEEEEEKDVPTVR